MPISERIRQRCRRLLYPIRERLICSEREAILLVGFSTILLVSSIVRFVQATQPPFETGELARLDSLFELLSDSLIPGELPPADTVHIGYGATYDDVPARSTGVAHWVLVDTLEKPVVTFPLAINDADARSLQALPRIGPAMANRILAWRHANGPFRSEEDLLAVRGIGPRTLEKLLPLISFTSQPFDTLGQERLDASSTDVPSTPADSSGASS
ncbi:MAG: helix-hairpin-helix domain-containing protein [Bacteroidota bacterium]|nr:helix-hairpin-helix domain-containing protein [Bacteroidota bacterium]